MSEAEATLAARLSALAGDADRGGQDFLIGADGAATTYAELDALSAALARWLAARGVTRGDRVAVWLPNDPVWLGLFFGLARLGATLVAVNTRYRRAELQHLLSKSGARMLIYGGADGHADFADEIAGLEAGALPALQSLAVFRPAGAAPDRIGSWPVEVLDRDTLPDGEAPADAAAPDDPVILFTTSGTTSAAKLVVHTHRTIGAHMSGCADFFGFGQPGAAYLAVLPFCGVFGITATLCSLHAGNPVVVADPFTTEGAAQLMKRHGITHMFGSDDMFLRLWKHDPSVYDTARACGFARFTPGIEKELTRMAEAGVPLRGLYGASEVNALFSAQSGDLPVSERLEGGGMPAHPQAEIRVRDMDSGQLVPVGEVGILEVRAPTNCVGYFDNPEATARTIDSEGFVSTSDLVRMRPDGSFVYVARNGDVLRLSGFLTDPAEIEEAIEALDGVERAQVVGVSRGGRPRPYAFVILNGDFDKAAARAALDERLAHYKVPLDIVPLDAFPTVESANGLKIQKARLKAMAQARVDEEAAA